MTLGHTQAGNSTWLITVCLDRSMVFQALKSPHGYGVPDSLRKRVLDYRERAITGDAPTLPVPAEPSALHIALGILV